MINWLPERILSIFVDHKIDGNAVRNRAKTGEKRRKNGREKTSQAALDAA
jgi:hypothetical protein